MAIADTDPDRAERLISAAEEVIRSAPDHDEKASVLLDIAQAAAAIALTALPSK